MEKIYDMIIIGGGPAGYSAALYAARAGLSTLVLEKLSAGGQMALTDVIENYPGYVHGIDGYELGERMQQGAERFGAVTELAEVRSVDLKAEPKVVETSEGTFLGRTVVLATGAGPRELGLPNEQVLVGRGVHYCAACDGMRYRGRTVAVIGGGNSAVADAMQLARVAAKVIIVHRRDSLRAEKIHEENLRKLPNVEFRWNSAVSEILADTKVTGLRLWNTATGEMSEMEVDGVFVSIGRKPASELAEDQLALDRSGYVVAGESTRTNIPGVFAVGDVRTKQVRQVVTAVADGAVAVHYAGEYLA